MREQNLDTIDSVSWNLTELSLNPGATLKLLEQPRFRNEVRNIILDIANRHDSKASNILIEIIQYQRLHWQDVVLAMNTLADLNPNDAIPTVTALYESYRHRPNSWLRLNSQFTLARLGQPKFVRLMPTLLFGQTIPEREGALLTIIHNNGKSAIDLYFKLLTSDLKRIKAHIRPIAELLQDEINFAKYYFATNGVSAGQLTNILLKAPNSSRILSLFSRDFGRNNVFDTTNLDVCVACKILMHLGINESVEHLKMLYSNPKTIDDPINIHQAQPITSDISDVWFEAADNRANHVESGPRVYYSRPNQAAFRVGVLQLYGQRCAVCGLDILELIEAAHIITKQHNGIDSPQNGLPLCCLHHKAFDSGMFTINPADYSIETRPNGPTRFDLKIQYANLRHLLNLPHTEVLTWRWQEWCRSLANLQ